MTTDALCELINQHYYRTADSPTTLIVERDEFERWAREAMALVQYKINALNYNKITIRGCSLRVIFATNLNDGEVIVI